MLAYPAIRAGPGAVGTWAGATNPGAAFGVPTVQCSGAPRPADSAGKFGDDGPHFEQLFTESRQNFCRDMHWVNVFHNIWCERLSFGQQARRIGDIRAAGGAGCHRRGISVVGLRLMTRAVRAAGDAAIRGTLRATLRAAIASGVALAPVLWLTAGPAAAQSERYVPSIWVDPDGCEHWAMDDGAEGYMTPHVNRQGIPVCRRGNVCGVMNADQFFATDKWRITPANQQRLAEFFRSASASAFIIAGHTDSRASDEYNIRLSYNRATAVARVAAATGARVSDVRGYGERMPRAANTTARGMAQNRRVEIICIR